MMYRDKSYIEYLFLGVFYERQSVRRTEINPW